MREALGRIVHTCRVLPRRARARVRLPALPRDGAPRRPRAHAARWARALAQDTPERSLFVLRHGMTNLLEVTTGLTRLPRVPFRLFYALLGVAQREIGADAYFNPLHALEFRPEFDRITNAQMLELIRSVSGRAGAAARRADVPVALPDAPLLCSSPRASRASPRTRRGARSRCVYLVLSVLRSDARALSGYLRRRAGPLLAGRLRGGRLPVPASEIERSTTSGCSRAATSFATSRRRSRASPRTSASRCAAPSSATSPRSTLRPSLDELRAAVQSA